MDESLRQLWSFCIWIAGIGITVFLALFGWILNIHKIIFIKEDVHKTLDKISFDLNEIREALIGDYDRKGLLTKHHELEDRVHDLEVKT